MFEGVSLEAHIERSLPKTISVPFPVKMFVLHCHHDQLLVKANGGGGGGIAQKLEGRSAP